MKEEGLCDILRGVNDRKIVSAPDLTRNFFQTELLYYFMKRIFF